MPIGASMREQSGQATVEAAFLLPVLFLLIVIVVQPVCLLYTRSIMQSAAAEGCRLVSTQPSSVADQALRDYLLRRLSAVPDVDVFHIGGGGGWSIEIEGAASSRFARVSIATSARPLPLIGAAAALMGASDENGNVSLRVDVVETVKPGWLEGDYGAWSSMW